MICPKCGSSRVTATSSSETTTRKKIKGFGWIKACLGYLIFSVPGIFCGFCGMGKGRTRTTTRTRVTYICGRCGKHF